MSLRGLWPVGASSLAVALLALASAAAEPWTVWKMDGGVIEPAAFEAAAAPVGSIQKLWVIRAWADANPDAGVPPPTASCTRASRCWNRAGHGTLGLRRAVAVSCNAYFQALAAGLGPDRVRRALEQAGFEVHGPLTPALSIGLETSARAVAIRPATLLRAFHSFLTSPWPVRDDVRRAAVDGLRDASEEGTGSAVGVRGIAVKTGTVESLDGTPLATSGWAIAADPSGTTVRLALLGNGTGAMAAGRLAGLWQESRRTDLREEPGAAASAERLPIPSRPLPAVVRVQLFSALDPSGITATNAGPFPLPVSANGRPESWTGPGGSLELGKGTRLGNGAWELAVAPYGLVRVVRGSLERPAARPVLTASLRDWVEGVLRAEARSLPPERRREFVPVVLRFLLRPPRHRNADVCDLSHCALFGGFGPDVSWPRPDVAAVTPDERSGSGPRPLETLLDDAAWADALAAAAAPGPSLWSSSCGGEPLSERAVWGSGPETAEPCPRQALHAAERPWVRVIPRAAIESAFGGPVEAIEAVERRGVRLTVVRAAGRSRELLFDDLHRRIARVSGWDALPSLPDSWSKSGTGWRVTGRGRGHRVGFCLAGD